MLQFVLLCAFITVADLGLVAKMPRHISSPVILVVAEGTVATRVPPARTVFNISMYRFSGSYGKSIDEE